MSLQVPETRSNETPPPYSNPVNTTITENAAHLPAPPKPNDFESDNLDCADNIEVNTDTADCNLVVQNGLDDYNPVVQDGEGEVLKPPASWSTLIDGQMGSIVNQEVNPVASAVDRPVDSNRWHNGNDALDPKERQKVKNTDASTKVAMTAYKEFQKELYADETAPEMLDRPLMIDRLADFALRARRQDQKPYKPQVLKGMVMSVCRGLNVSCFVTFSPIL